MPFRDILGHGRLVGLLARSVREQTLPPSLIFAGPDGIGKRLAAVSTAQALNCTAPRQGPASQKSQITAIPPLPIDACGVCPACTRIARGIHPDVLLVGPGENGSIKIDQVRDIIERAAYRPFEGRRRVVIIDEAEALVPAAQNALLKTLEEPPSLSVFVLVTSRPDTLLATVRSRCQRLRFRPLDVDDVAAALVKRGRSSAEARAIAATADGSVRVALEADGSDLADARDVAVRVLAQAAAIDDPRRRLEGAKDLLSKTGAGGAKDRDQLASHLHAMSSLLRDVELLSVRADPTALANADVQSALDRLTVFRGQRGVDAFSAVESALGALDRNAGVKIVADWLVLHL